MAIIRSKSYRIHKLQINFKIFLPVINTNSIKAEQRVANVIYIIEFCNV